MNHAIVHPNGGGGRGYIRDCRGENLAKQYSPKKMATSARQMYRQNFGMRSFSRNAAAVSTSTTEVAMLRLSEKQDREQRSFYNHRHIDRRDRL
jgi:hypothetical protein